GAKGGCERPELVAHGEPWQAGGGTLARDHGHMPDVASEVQADEAHGVPSADRHQLGRHDTYGSALAMAQPVESQGRPDRLTDSRSTRSSACPSMVSLQPLSGPGSVPAATAGATFIADRLRAMTRRIDLLGVDDLADGEMQLVWVDGTDPVLVIRNGDEFHAMQGTCSHQHFELDR